jgi:type IV secretory pathway VirB10-like protein
MEQRRKIVIPVGSEAREAGGAKNFDGAETVPARLFDEEATMGARPVVPLAGASTKPSSRFPLLALVVILAVGAGVAGGFVIGLYKSRQTGQGESAASTAATTAAGTEQTPAQEQLPASIATEKSPTPPTRTVSSAENATTERAARDKSSKRDDDEVLAPVEVLNREREKREREDRIARNRDDRIERDREEERESRRERRQRRRRAREAEEMDTDVNRQIERGARELNRIREIFEGQRP